MSTHPNYVLQLKVRPGEGCFSFDLPGGKSWNATARLGRQLSGMWEKLPGVQSAHFAVNEHRGRAFESDGPFHAAELGAAVLLETAYRMSAARFQLMQATAAGRKGKAKEAAALLTRNGEQMGQLIVKLSAHSGRRALREARATIRERGEMNLGYTSSTPGKEVSPHWQTQRMTAATARDLGKIQDWYWSAARLILGSKSEPSAHKQQREISTQIRQMAEQALNTSGPLKVILRRDKRLPDGVPVPIV
jgi:hypothetical protein